MDLGIVLPSPYSSLWEKEGFWASDPILEGLKINASFFYIPLT